MDMVTLVRADGEAGEFEVTAASAPGWVATGNWSWPADGPDAAAGSEQDGVTDQPGGAPEQQPGDEVAGIADLAGQVQGPAPLGMPQGELPGQDGADAVEQQETSGESSSDNPAAPRGRRNR